MAKVPLTVRIDSELRAALAELAARSRRSLTAEMEHMIEERARRDGVVPAGLKAEAERAAAPKRQRA